MLITPRFVFVHIPKTGGDFIRRICSRHLPADWIVPNAIAKHGPDVEIPEEYRDLPRFALIRNPWDWHVSWFHYLAGAGRPDEHRDRVRAMNPWFVDLSGDFRFDFATTMRRLYDPAVAATFAPQSQVRQAAEQGVALLTMHLRRQAGTSLAEGRITVGHFENLRRDFAAFLATAGVPLTDRFRLDLFERPPVNRSQRSRFQDYYDPELRDLIGRLAVSMVTGYGYALEDAGPESHEADPAAPLRPAAGADGASHDRRLS